MKIINIYIFLCTICKCKTENQKSNKKRNTIKHESF